MDVERRTCEVSAACGAIEVNLTMHFPDDYPNNSVPTFVLNRELTVDDGAQSKLIRVSIFLVHLFFLCGFLPRSFELCRLFFVFLFLCFCFWFSLVI